MSWAFLLAPRTIWLGLDGYLLMRRLDFAREQIAGHRALVEVALEAGFADQAHFTRMFKAAFGLTPARYSALRANTVEGRVSLPFR
jgi:AraC-like DNA-binding protein